VRFLDADAVTALPPAAAVAAITEALRGGLDPSGDPARSSVALRNGEFLLMPSEVAAAAGVKVVTVAPGNPARGLPRIHAAYLLFDAETLTVTAVLDGTALTTLRTPAVSVAAVAARLPERPLRVAVFGTGPQGLAHVATLAALRSLDAVTYLARDPARVAVDAVRLGSTAATDALASADVVVCATSARTPLFDSTVLRDDAVVIAVGSHEAGARELDSALMARATVVVEDRATALREAGDVVLAIGDHALAPVDLVPMHDVVTGAARIPADRPLVFKSVGMAWEDLAVAAAVLNRR
jgi:ornithine cyclodeaminase